MNSVPFASPDSLSEQRPTSVRYRVLFVTFLTSLLLYLDRFCMTYAQRYVKEDLGLSEAQIDSCMSIFFLSYGLSQVPTGGLTDKYGSRIMLAIYVLAWSLFTAAMGWVGGFVSLLVVRLAAGMSQAGAYPTGARVVGQWTPLARRGVANSIIALGGRVGGALAPPLTAALVVAFVPLSVSPLLTNDDLLDPVGLSAQLAGDAKPQPSGEELTADQRAQSDVIRLVRDEVGSRSTISADTGRGALLTELNRLIEDGIDASPDQLAQLKLEAEARPLLDRRESLTKPERHRLTRLILEALFPTSIRKLYVYGWRPVMWWYGLAGIVVAGWFYWQVRDRAAQHPRVNAAELRVIGSPPDAPAMAERVPWLPILRSPSLWLISIASFGTNVGWVFLVSLLDRYLYSVHRVPYVERGFMQSLPLFIGWIGMLLGGWWTDRLTRRRGVRIGRALPIAFSRFIAMAAFLLMLLHPSPWVCIALLSAVAFGTDLGIPAFWSICQDIGGRSVAAVLGWGNMWGNLGAFVSPMLLGLISRHWDWDAVFLVCAAAFLIAGLAAAFIDATKPVVPEAPVSD